MVYQKELNPADLILAQRIQDFVPREVFDIHVHPYHAAHFPANEWDFLNGIEQLGCRDHVQRLQRYMPVKTVHGLYFGLPRLTANRPVMNAWVNEEVKNNASSLSRSLMVVAPGDDKNKIAEELKSEKHSGIKVYHCYANRPDTMNAGITEYAPEWMWELLQDTNGVLLLHIVKEDAIEDADNQRELKRLCRRYPNVKLILAHIARSFNYRNAQRGLAAVADIENLVVDTSAICESASFTAALKILGPQRVLWGSDFGISEMRGRCITTGTGFTWLHPQSGSEEKKMTLIGIESLLNLQDSCVELGLNRSDVEDIFCGNAKRWLQLPVGNDGSAPADNPTLWQKAKQVISGGTGLLSKRAEQFSGDWPVFFSRSKGCSVWTLNGHHYLDCAGGIGAVLLGYADEDVNSALTRRMAMGSYASLVNPEETLLGEKLLQLHPWAGKLRYARTGGEAMSVAVRIARAASGKTGIAFCGYHGWHDWYLAANLGAGNALDGHLLPGLQPKGVPRELAGTAVPFRYNDLESFETAIKKLGDNFAAVVMEPMRSQWPENGFLEQVQKACRQKNAVLVIDEITSGLRYGYPGALSRIGLEPDIVVYAKAMGNGVPFATIIGREEVMDAAEQSFISSSYFTDGLGTAAALAVLAKMEAGDLSAQVWNKGVALLDRLQQIAAKYPACMLVVGGMPASPTFSFTSPVFGGAAKKLFTSRMLSAGILVSGIFYLMHAHQPGHLQQFVTAFDETLAYISHQVNAGKMPADERKSFQQGFTRLA